MRYLCALLIVLGLPLSAGAQRHQRPSPPPPPPAIGSIGLPLPVIGLPLPATGLPNLVPYRPWVWTAPPPAWERYQVPAWEKKGAPAWERGPRPSQPIHNPRDRRRLGRPVYPPVYPAYGIGYSYGVPYVMAPDEPPAPAPVPDVGYLRLEVEPAALLQIYVDGVYVGTPADHRGEIELRSGAHRIEVRAPGYESMTFDVRIEAERGTTYRGDLRPSGAAVPPTTPAPAVVPTGSKTLYVIRGCYLGNVLPDPERLPAGCDISRMKTHAPQ